MIQPFMGFEQCFIICRDYSVEYIYIMLIMNYELEEWRKNGIWCISGYYYYHLPLKRRNIIAIIIMQVVYSVLVVGTSLFRISDG
jgi:hypothetical protein